MMKAKWKKFDDNCQELVITDWIEANVYDPSRYMCRENSKDWSWDVVAGSQDLGKGQAKTESLAKRAGKRQLIKLFRQLGKALDYDVE